MSSQHRQILLLLKSRGKHGAYNSELQGIAHRFGARVKELVDGDYDGTKHNITCKKIAKGKFKYTYHSEDMNPDQVMDYLTQASPADYKPTKLSPETKEKWEQVRLMLGKSKPESSDEVYQKKINELKEKQRAIESWIEANADRMTPRAYDLSLTKRDQVEDQVNYYQNLLKGGE